MDDFLKEIISFMSAPPTEDTSTVTSQPLPTNAANNPSIIYRDFLPIPYTSDQPHQTAMSGPATRAPLLPPPATTLSLNVGPTEPLRPKVRSKKPTSKNGPLSEENRYKRMMRNREAAIRARERKQIYINYLENDIVKLAEENAILRRTKLQMERVAATQRSKKSTLHRTSSALF
ncbi:bZIP transcription factor 27-like [Humulus lupulus]|uniref:bZIP transcription factor 27-like n=1 Tax=Humulus lupulus TaxID=3486 RepID=UPI002B41604E|nr:bZIP transcription factor 27-like [Humulus lupulus]